MCLCFRLNIEALHPGGVRHYYKINTASRKVYAGIAAVEWGSGEHCVRKGRVNLVLIIGQGRHATSYGLPVSDTDFGGFFK